MDRRYFLRTLIGGVAATAAVRTWPFRVYSFPTSPVLANLGTEYAEQLYNIFRKYQSDRLFMMNMDQEAAFISIGMTVYNPEIQGDLTWNNLERTQPLLPILK